MATLELVVEADDELADELDTLSPEELATVLETGLEARSRQEQARQTTSSRDEGIPSTEELEALTESDDPVEAKQAELRLARRKSLR